MMRRVLPSVRNATRSRNFCTSQQRQTSWSPGPAPPRLPKEEQEIFEQLQKQSTGAFSTPRAPPQINQSPHAQAEPQSTAEQEQQLYSTQAQSQRQPPQINQSPQSSQETVSQASPQKQPTVRDGEELHPNIRRGAPPEFEGDVNPKTGETGGPKNEPLRWGHESDWSYNGRVTDF